jgi:single-strand DNA-binding protein
MSKATLTIEGFVAKEPEPRDAGQHRVVEVVVPVTPSRKVNGEWVEEKEKTVWFEATFWDEHADVVMNEVRKGSLVQLTGGVELEVYKKRDGEPGAKVKLSFPTIAVVVRRPKRGEAVQQRQGNPADEPWAATPTAAPAAASDVWNTPGNFSDEVPF